MSGEKLLHLTFCGTRWDQEGFYRRGSYANLTAMTVSFWMSRRETDRKTRVFVGIDKKPEKAGIGALRFFCFSYIFLSPHLDFSSSTEKVTASQALPESFMSCLTVGMAGALCLVSVVIMSKLPFLSYPPCNHMLVTVRGTSQDVTQNLSRHQGDCH